MADRFQELIAVGVDFFDLHGGDDQTELTEDDVLGKLLNLAQTKTQQTLGGVLHDARLGGDTDRKTGGNIDTDVLTRQGVGQVYVDGNRREVEVLVILDDRPYKSRAAMDTFGRHALAVLVVADFTVDNHDLVGRTFAVPRQDDSKHAEDQQSDDRESD